MDKKCKKFIDECSANHTTVATFVKLFGMWDALDTSQRGQIIIHEIDARKIKVNK